MTIKHKILSLLLTVLMLAGAMPYTAMASEGSGDLAYGKAGSAQTVTLAPSELLSLLLGEELTDTLTEAECSYLNAYSDRILEYSDRIPAEYVRLHSDATSISIEADAYTYEAENGTQVTWVPNKAVCGDRTASFVQRGDVYEAQIEGVSKDAEHPENNRVKIEYTCELSISAEVVDALSNFAYNDAVDTRDVPTTAEYAAARAAYEGYLRAMDEYEDRKAAYDAYLADKADYDAEKEKYDEYLRKKAAYDERLADYEQYMRDLETYRAAKAEYDRTYQENRAAYEEYVAYLSNLNRIRASTYAMESLFVEPSSGKTRELYGALQNAELVEMFERYRDWLVSGYGVSGDTLTHLRETSDDLNAMLRAYAEAREQSEEAAFAYYKENYHEIARLFNYLYDNMREILTGKIFNHMCAKMELDYQGEMLAYKKWRIKNVLAHIYLICQVLDDDETANGTFRFYSDDGLHHTYYFSDLLDQNLILTDNNNACPDELNWMPEVEPVTLAEPPVEPEAVEKLPLPPAVEEPQAPEPVDEPSAPEAVPAVPEATEEELARYAFADRTVDIVAALEAGTLTPRPAATRAQTVTLTATQMRPVAFGEGLLVTFYDADGSIFEVFEVSEGDAIPLPSEQPTETYETPQYTYEFQGFATAPDGDPEDLSSMTMPAHDLAIYAIYEKTVRQYRVTVKQYDGDPAPTETVYDYGAMPSLPAKPQKPQTHDTVYTFAGWSPMPSAVTEDVTYVAQYVSSQRLYAVSWQTPSGTVLRREPYGVMPTPPTIPSVYYEGTVRYDFIDWDAPLSAVTEEGMAYEARYRRTDLATGEEAITLTASLGEFQLSGLGARTDIRGLISVAKAEKKRLSLSFSAMSVRLDVAAVSDLAREGVTFVERLHDASGGIGIGFYTDDGRAISLLDGTMQMSLAYEPKEGAIPCVLERDTVGNTFLVASTAEESALAVDAVAHRTYRVDYQYALSVKGEGGSVFANGKQFFAGEKPSLTTYCVPENVLASMTLTNDLTGERITLESLKDFTMPDYPATLSVTFAPRTYTVTFISRGEVVSEAQYVMGDTVVVPEIETDFDEDGYRYTFIGWSAPIDTVTGDAVYTAKFFAVPIEEVPDNPDGNAWAMGAVLWQIGIPALLGLAAAVVGIVFLVRWRRKKRS